MTRDIAAVGAIPTDSADPLVGVTHLRAPLGVLGKAEVHRGGWSLAAVA